MLATASGDLRNVLKTLERVPTTYKGRLKVVINDKSFDVIARNAILLLMALVANDKNDTIVENDAISSMLHIWYSAFLTRSHADFLSKRIRPLIEAACQEIKDDHVDHILTKQFSSGVLSLNFTFTKAEWHALLSLCSERTDLTTAQAKDIRTDSTLAPAALDNREVRLMYLTGPRRVCEHRFLEDGILLPFGHSRDPHTVPNPHVALQRNPWYCS